MSSIFVTGGGGYIGSHACHMLKAQGFTPVCYDSFATGWRAAARFGPVIEGDIRDEARLTEALSEWRPAAVMHFAALIEVGASVRDPAAYWSVNVGGTRTLLEAMRATGVDKLVYSSTCAVNGDLDGVPVDETSPMGPLSPYATTKAAVEMMAADYGRAYGMKCLGFRYFNVAGADPSGEIGEFHQPESHLIPLAIQALNGERPALSIFGTDYPTRDGTCIRDFVHVCDIADAHLRAIDYLDRDTRAPIICLGTNHGMSVREVVDQISAQAGRAVPAEICARRDGDAVSLVSSSALAARELGWQPQNSHLPRIIEDALRWHAGPGYTA
ncbi:MAG: UDP-glucose 4-epimerase GalE [Pseudomonadota bacterium]